VPELPEVETIRRQLEKEIVDYVIADVWYDRPKMLRPSVEKFVKGVKGRKIVGVARRGKLLVFELGGGCFVCHLRLSGRLLVRQKGDRPDDYVHVVIECKMQKAKCKNLELRFAEARQFGYMEYLPDQISLEKILSKYGPEPLGDLTAGRFYSTLQKTSRPVKVVLMDQNKIAGIGNIYANDALFLARIHPQTPARNLTRSQSDNLLEKIEQVFKEGLEYGGASDQWYLQVHGEKGSYQEHFRVYGRTGQPCDVCGTEIKRIEVGGRGTFFCPSCQKAPNSKHQAPNKHQITNSKHQT
jgi:formamidopyrimidine-DNA glycosylase